jgi:hypothetical protein
MQLIEEVSEVRASLLYFRDRMKLLCEEMTEKKVNIKSFDPESLDFCLESTTPLGFIDKISRDTIV